MPSITDFNGAHLHLLLNHIPTVGSVVAMGLLVVALVRRNEHLKHAGLEVLFVIAVLTLPAYMSGVIAQKELREQPELSAADTATRVHQDAALAGFAVTELAGFVAWLALWQYRRRGRAARGLVPAVTLLSIVAIVLMARAATLGGEIRHPEIRSGVSTDAAAPAQSPAAGAVPSPAEGTPPSPVEGPALSPVEGPALSPVEGSEEGERYVTSRISFLMVNSSWVWPAAEAVHFLGLSLSFGVLLAVNLRILGVMRQVAFADMHRLLPWGMLGFGVNLITGMLFFIGQPNQYLDSAPFYWKIVFLMIAGANFLYLTVFTRAWANDEVGYDSSLADKAMAVSSLAAWLGVMYAGRMLPFIGHAF